MSTTPEAVFQHHYQKDGSRFCSASAHEFIMKIHEEIDLDDQPLQSLSVNERRGFEFSVFLSKYGYKEKQHQLAASAEVIKLIEAEVSENRHPLVSDISGNDAHILVAFKKSDEIVFADPGLRTFVTSTTQETESRIQAAITARPDGTFVHILTYSKS